MDKAILALADGSVFEGYAVGARGEGVGEVVFNTSMTGYQEILSDPSYAYQMITFTYPHIGNVGANEEDDESRGVFATGIIVHHLSQHYSNFRAKTSLQDYLEKHGVVGIAGVDTRGLVLHIREQGAQIGVIASGEAMADAESLVARARSMPSMDGQNLVNKVSTKEPYTWRQTIWEPGVGYRDLDDDEMSERPRVVVIDCGVKRNILRLLVHYGFEVHVVPSFWTPEQIRALSPDALFLSNGPGDPAAVTNVIQTVRQFIGSLPIFGICLGHQLLGLALNAPTYKLKFGHRGANHPVQRDINGRVEITSQNHGYAADFSMIPDTLSVSHVNLNDTTVSGFDIPDLQAFSVQYHPEASPGPHDSRYLFAKFRDIVG